jgi:purine-cytosine permease-like protein
VGFVRRILRRFGVWIVLASLVYLSWWALSEADLSALWNASAEGGSSFWLGVDLVIAITVSWVPLVSDYTRFSRDRRSAFWGSGAGYFLGGTWMLALGAFIVLSRGVSDPVEIPPAVAAGWFGAALAARRHPDRRTRRSPTSSAVRSRTSSRSRRNALV